MRRITIAFIALALGGSVYFGAGQRPVQAPASVKNAREKANIKGQQMAQVAPGVRTRKGNHITLSNITAIEGGVQVYVKANNGKPIAFGKDGTIEEERFVIINPPVLVQDPNGDIEREYIDEDPITGTTTTYTIRYREDPEEALLQVIEHNISLVGKPPTHMIPGKRGNTVTTVFPDANPESTSVDGYTGYEPAAIDTWSNTRNAATGNYTVDNAANSTASNACSRISSGGTAARWFTIARSMFLFDTSSLPDTDTISSAVLSIYGTGSTFNAFTDSSNIYSSTPASNTALADADYDQYGSTAFATAIAHASWSTSAYNDFTLNASGIAAITATAVSKFGYRSVKDAGDNSTWIASSHSITNCFYADQTGTTNDPKLVITHAAAASSVPSKPQLIWFD